MSSACFTYSTPAWACSLVVDIFYHKHAIFAWEGYFAFYSVYGFVACVILVIVAKYVLRPMVMRKEDYYDD